MKKEELHLQEQSNQNKEIVFRVTIKNTKPVELVEYTKSLMALSAEFVSYCKNNQLDMKGEVKLFIKEVKTGSIISDLIACAPALLQCVEYTNCIIDFYNHLKTVFDYFLGKNQKNPEFTKKMLGNIENLMMPGINDNQGSISYEVIQGDKVVNNYFITNADQNIIQNRARNEALIQPSDDAEYYSVPFYWHQARNSDKNTIDKGIIEQISKMPMKTIMEPELKKKMISGNLFESTYIVDVKTLSAKGKLIGYHITNLIDVIEEN